MARPGYLRDRRQFLLATRLCPSLRLLFLLNCLTCPNKLLICVEQNMARQISFGLMRYKHQAQENVARSPPGVATRVPHALRLNSVYSETTGKASELW